MRYVRTWHNDRPFRIQSLRVDLNGCQSVVTCVPIQQIALKAQNHHSDNVLNATFVIITCFNICFLGLNTCKMNSNYIGKNTT